jgi:hypothetical protein
VTFLTVYVPTFERPELAVLLGSLVPQLTPDVRVVVSDNSPSGFAEPICEGLLVEYSRRGYNIGGDPNVLRALTEPGEYVWIVGDDDVLLPGAVAAVLEAIQYQPDRIVLTTPDAKIDAFHGTMHDWILSLTDRSILIAATLITANVYRQAALDLAVGVRKLDTHYPVSWAALSCERVIACSVPVFVVGVGHQQRIGGVRRIWQDYLDALTWTHDVPAIPVEDCARWNFPSLVRQ